MFHRVETASRKLKAYHGLIDDELYEEIVQLARRIRGIRILHINSTSTRGGIPEILGNEVPLLNDLGAKAAWQTFDVPNDVYALTKYIHNGLQGSAKPLDVSGWSRYETFNKQLAKQFKPGQWDVIFIHDHQPAALLPFMANKGKAKWLWRCHVDLTQPNPDYQKRFIDYIQTYDGVIFQASDYVFKGYQPTHLLISPVAIDPLSPKNLPMSKNQARQILRSFGIDTHWPIMTRLSRFDPWKDIPGAVHAWQLAKQKIPALQLVIAGAVSPHDIQGQAILEEVSQLITGQADVHLLINKISGRTAKAFLVASDVMLQNSIREGLGLSVSEALWSLTPVIGNDEGGMRLHIVNGKNGYLVDNIKDCADRLVTLLQDQSLATKMGEFGHEYVRKHFLLPRMMRDELRFIHQLLQE
ncbi:glycosyltransferase [Candidatus Saccharibacteria bacterium]|nr:glycosyltransferase [Candidatus Saccharibacteria bacterium]